MAYVIIFQILFHFVDNPTTSLFRISRHVFKLNAIITLQCFSFDKEVFNTIPDVRHTSYLNREVLKRWTCMGLLPWPMIMCFVHIFFMLLFYFYSIIYFNILFYFFRPHKIRLRLSEDAAGASTSKKSCRRPQSRRTEQEILWRIQSGEVHDTKKSCPNRETKFCPIKENVQDPSMEKLKERRRSRKIRRNQ